MALVFEAEEAPKECDDRVSKLPFIYRSSVVSAKQPNNKAKMLTRISHPVCNSHKKLFNILVFDNVSKCLQSVYQHYLVSSETSLIFSR